MSILLNDIFVLGGLKEIAEAVAHLVIFGIGRDDGVVLEDDDGTIGFSRVPGEQTADVVDAHKVIEILVGQRIS